MTVEVWTWAGVPVGYWAIAAGLLVALVVAAIDRWGMR